MHAAVPELASACRRLEQIGPAPTLVHGDLHPWNVALGAGGPLVYDWSDAAVSHPFVDLPVFVRRAEDAGVRRALRSAYLARWSDALAPSALSEAGDIALVVGSVYQARSYVAITESLDPEDRIDMAGGAGAYLRYAVEMLRDGIDGGSAVDA
jgi:aminoglycoside phosphotransferase (APT) family kinase protein